MLCYYAYLNTKLGFLRKESLNNALCLIWNEPPQKKNAIFLSIAAILYKSYEYITKAKLNLR